MNKAGAMVLLLALIAGAQSEWSWLHPAPQGHHLYGIVWADCGFRPKDPPFRSLDPDRSVATLAVCQS